MPNTPETTIVSSAEMRTLRIEIRQMSKNIERIIRHLGIDQGSRAPLGEQSSRKPEIVHRG